MRFSWIFLVAFFGVSACRSSTPKFETIEPPAILAGQKVEAQKASAKTEKTDEQPNLLDLIKKMDDEAAGEQKLASETSRSEMLLEIPKSEVLAPSMKEVPRFRPFGIVDNMELSLGWGKVPRQVATQMSVPRREIVTTSSNYWRQYSPYFFTFSGLRISPRYNGNGANFSTKAGYRGDVTTDAWGVTILSGSGDGITSYTQNKFAFDYGVRKDTGHDLSAKAADYRIVEKTPRFAGEWIRTRIQGGRISLFQTWVRGEYAPPGERTSFILQKGKRVSLVATDHAVNRSNITFGGLAEFYQTKKAWVTIATSLELGEVREEKAINGILSLRFRFFGHLDIAPYYRRVQGGDHSSGMWVDFNLW